MSDSFIKKLKSRMLGKKYMLGKTHTEESKRKISKTKTKYKNGDIWRNKGGSLYTKENNKIRKLKVSEIGDLL